jgi:tetratricopeptide (TPR) repeat protein
MVGTLPVRLAPFVVIALIAAPAFAGDGVALDRDRTSRTLERAVEAADRALLSSGMRATADRAEPYGHFERSMIRLARIQQRNGRYDAAERRYRRAWRVREARLGPHHPDTIDLLDDLALVSAAQGKYDEAKALTTQALEIHTRARGAESLEAGVCLFRLGAYAVETGAVAEAESYLGRSIPITNAAFGTDASLAGTLETFAASRPRDDAPGAEALYVRALALRRTELPDDHGDVLALLARLGRAYEDRGAWGAAEAVYQQAFEARPDDRVAARLWTVRALQGMRENADTALARHVALRRPVGADDWPGRTLRFMLGELGADELLSAAGVDDEPERLARLCEAHEAIGAVRLVDGDIVDAVSHFRLSVGTEAFGAPAYGRALAMIEHARTTDAPALITSVDVSSESPDF